MRRALGWIPREERAPVALDGTATLSDGRRIAISVTDLSRDGCRVASDETLKIGESLIVDVDARQSVPGTVRWSLFGSAGIRFQGH